MNMLIYIIFGGLVGWVASLVMGTDARQGIFLNIIVGVVGSMLGNWLAGYFGISGVSGFNLTSFLVALVGAIILLALLRLIRR